MHKTRTQRAAELRQGIEEYFDARREENRFPTEAGMLLNLGLSEEEQAQCFWALK